MTDVLEQVDRSVVDCHSLAYRHRDDRVTSEITTWCGVAISRPRQSGYVAVDGIPAEWVPPDSALVCRECRRQEEVAARIRKGPFAARIRRGP